MVENAKQIILTAKILDECTYYKEKKIIQY